MWTKDKGTETDVVLMTKAIIVRNIKGFPFCPKMSTTDKESVIGMVRQAASKMNLNFMRADELSDDVMADLYDKQLVNLDVYRDRNNKAILINEDDGINIAVNDKEHITIEVVGNGSQIAQTYAKADSIACKFEQEMDIAFSDRYGFLTSDTNKMGTGLRIFSLVSIPGIEKTSDALNVLNRRLAKYDWKLAPLATVAGVKVAGVYVLGNIATLGVTEKELISRAARVIEDVVKLERSCRKTICKRKGGIVEDQYYRSYAILRYARRLEAQEAFNLVSWLRLGFGYFDDKENIVLTWDKLNTLTNKLVRNSKDIGKSKAVTAAASAQCSDMVRSLLKGDEE